MAEVIDREGADVVIYDQEFTAIVDRALQAGPTPPGSSAGPTRPTAPLTLDELIERHAGQRPAAQRRARATSSC